MSSCLKCQFSTRGQMNDGFFFLSSDLFMLLVTCCGNTYALACPSGFPDPASGCQPSTWASPGRRALWAALGSPGLPEEIPHSRGVGGTEILHRQDRAGGTGGWGSGRKGSP